MSRHTPIAAALPFPGWLPIADKPDVVKIADVWVAISTPDRVVSYRCDEACFVDGRWHDASGADLDWSDDMGHSSAVTHFLMPRGAEDPPETWPDYQWWVGLWAVICFDRLFTPQDVPVRCHRFFEEAGELVQSLGMSSEEAHQLVDYTWNRKVGDPPQEVGGTMVTLACLCLSAGLNLSDAAEVELARVNTPEQIAKIRAKDAAKPKFSALPGTTATPSPNA